MADESTRNADFGLLGRPGWECLPGVALSLLLLLPLAIGDRVAGLFSDSAVYLFMADHFSPWHAPSELARGYFHASRFPPGYPVLLGLLGAGSDAIPRAHVVNVLLTVLGTGLGAWLVRLRTHSAVLAAVVGVALAGTPGLAMAALETSSEPLFIVLLLSTLVALERPGARPEQRVLVAGLLAAAATWTREIGLLLAPWFLLLAWRRRCWTAALVGVLNAGLWSAWHLLRAQDAVSISYGDALRDTAARLAADPGAAFHPGSTLEAWVSIGAFGPGRSGGLALVAATLLALPALASRTRRLQADAWFAIGTLAIVLVWPYPGSAARLLLPLVPVALTLAAETLAGAAARVEPRARAAVLAGGAAALLGATLVATPHYAARLSAPVPDDLREFRGSAAWLSAATPDQGLLIAEVHARMTWTAAGIANAVPADAVVCSSVSEFAALHAQRAVMLIEPPRSGTPDSASIVRRCPYLFVLGFPRNEERVIPAYFPLEAVGNAYRPVQISALPAPMAATAPAQAFTAALFGRVVAVPVQSETGEVQR